MSKTIAIAKQTILSKSTVLLVGIVLGFALSLTVRSEASEPPNLDAIFSHDAQGRLILRAPKGLVVEGALQARSIEVQGDLRVAQSLQVAREAKVTSLVVAGPAKISGDVALARELKVKGDAVLEGALDADSLRIARKTLLRGEMVCERAVHLEAEVKMSRGLTVEDLRVKDDLSVDDDAEVRGDLSVRGKVINR